MRSLRRFLVWFVAVCAAFAAGIALGNGPLQGDSSPSRLALTNSGGRPAAAVATLRQEAALAAAVGRVGGPALLHGSLADASVGVFVLPGVPAAVVAGVARAVGQAGGQLVLVAHLAPQLVDPSRKTYVDSVAASSLRGLDDLRSSAGTSPYTRVGALIARAYTGHSRSLAVDSEASKIDAQLQGAKLAALRDPLQRRADAVVVLSRGGAGSADAVYAEHQIELQVIGALADASDGLVVAAPESASGSGGLLSELAGSRLVGSAVSTVNVSNSTLGQLIVPAALAAQVAGKPGAYGVRGRDVVLPPGLGRGSP